MPVVHHLRQSPALYVVIYLIEPLPIYHAIALPTRNGYHSPVRAFTPVHTENDSMPAMLIGRVRLLDDSRRVNVLKV
jgi:hypothetical protein